MKNGAFAPSVDKSNTLTADETTISASRRAGERTDRGGIQFKLATMLTRDRDCGLPGRSASPACSIALELSPQVSEAESLGSKGDPADCGN